MSPTIQPAAEGQKLLTELGGLRPGEVFFRAHNLMTSGDGTPAFKWGSTNLYTLKLGKPVYDFTLVDRIIDSYVARGIHPYLEIGFMPEAMSSAPAGVPYYRPWQVGVDYKSLPSGWSYPPRDYREWAELVYQWTRHNVQRYGRSEVARWYFEVWNEPNLDFYWRGTPEDFYRLHDFAIDAVRRALPEARVGGPDVAGSGGAFMDGFLRHITAGTNYATGKLGTPTDFLSFHAKGQPAMVDGHVRMDISKQLNTADQAFAMIASAPGLADRPIVIGENDPEGCAACPGSRMRTAMTPCTQATRLPSIHGSGSWRCKGTSVSKAPSPGRLPFSASPGLPATDSCPPMVSICRCSMYSDFSHGSTRIGSQLPAAPRFRSPRCLQGRA